jgi:hypothetical protein
MKFTFQFLGFLFCILFFASCKNELKLNAPYKEIPSIYAVINPQEKIQMIRINKVFLGEGDANQMAQVADSINYPAGELTVTLDKYVDGARVNAAPGKLSITFRDSVINNVKPGSFNTSQRVYVCSDDLHEGTVGTANYKVSGNYVLTVKNNKTGNVFIGRATAIDSVKGNQGVRPMSLPYYPYGLPIPSLIEYVDYASNDGGTVKFSPNNGIIYQLIIRVHFYEDFAAVRYNKYVDYSLGNKNAKDVLKFAGQDFINYSFKRTDFFTAMGVGLSKLNLNSNLVLGRKAFKIEYIVYATSQDYVDYMQYVTPSLSIAQSKPLYSNFDNQSALGIFTFRSRCSISKEMATFFVNEFAYNENTCAYQFFTSDNAKPGCRR